jgi:aspartyl protease family protein
MQPTHFYRTHSADISFQFVICFLAAILFHGAALHGQGSRISDLEQQLKDFKLKRSGANLISDGELELRKLLEEEKAIRFEMKKKYPTFKLIEDEDNKRSGNIQAAMRRYAEIQRTLAQQNLNALQHNQLVKENNAIVASLNEADVDKAWPARVKAARGEFNELRERYVSNLLNARKAADEAETAWEDLKANESLKKLVEEIAKETKQTIPLSASKGFRSTLNELKKLEGQVLSERIPLHSDGGNTFMISVVVQGQSPVDMVLDSGAGVISLPFKTAATLGLTPTAFDPDVTLVLADGRQVTAKRIIIPTVRVGKFEASQVEAAVLPAELTQAEPLLGMSFLKNFQFKVDSSQQVLTMAKVGMGDEDNKKSKTNSKKKSSK